MIRKFFSRIRIRIRVTQKARIRPDPDPDPDPQNWCTESLLQIPHIGTIYESP